MTPQAGEGAAGGTLTKRPGGAPGRPAAGGPIARKAAAARRPAAGGRPSGGAGGAGILRFYTDDAPGLKMCVPALPRGGLCFSSLCECDK